MGISYTAQVVVGFELTFRKVTTKRKKYNQDSGEPYETTEFSHEVAIAAGAEIASSEHDADMFCTGEKIEGLEIFESGYESGTKVLGEQRAIVGDCGADHAIFALAQSVALQSFANKHGVKATTHLMLSCG